MFTRPGIDSLRDRIWGFDDRQETSPTKMAKATPHGFSSGLERLKRLAIYIILYIYYISTQLYTCI